MEMQTAHREYVEKYADPLRIQTELRARFPNVEAGMVAAAVAQFDLRRRASIRLDLPEGALLASTALEQASSAVAARFHASLFDDPAVLLEICSGIGSDSLELARVARKLICVESDRLTADFLRNNLAAAGRHNAVVLRGQAESWLPFLRLDGINAVFADPSRRTVDSSRRTPDFSRRKGIRRILEAEDCSPPLSLLKHVSMNTATIVKIAPGMDVHDTHWQKIFVAVRRECPEQLLLHGFNMPAVSAVDADSGRSWSPSETASLYTDTENIRIQKPKYLIEPHSALIRTGALKQYLAELDAAPLDPQIAYGYSEAQPQASNWHQTFRILEIHPWKRRTLQEIVQQYQLGPETEIKKRGFPLQPDELRKRLRWTGSRKAVLLLTRQSNRHLIIFAERCTEQHQRI